LQNFGPIRTFERSYFDKKLTEKGIEQSSFSISTDLNFQGKTIQIELLLDMTTNSVPSFKIDKSLEELVLLIDGLFHFWESYGAKQLLMAEIGELESFLREKNHVPVFEKKNLAPLAELRYGLQLIFESLYSGVLLHDVSRENLSFETSRQLEELFNSRLNGASETTIELLDQSPSECIYRFKPQLEEGTWKELWVETIQKLANQLKHNNARQWVDKPWQ
jgi:hypothetical protein